MIEKPFIEQIEYIKSLNDCQHSIYDYLRCIWLPELYKQDNLNDKFIPEDNDYMKSVEDLVIRLNMHVIESPEGIVEYICLLENTITKFTSCKHSFLYHNEVKEYGIIVHSN